MRRLGRLVIAAIVAATAFAAQAADRTLLIQVAPDGGYRVWFSEGTSRLSDDEVVTLWVNATPEGGATLATMAGPARATATTQGVVVELLQARADASLLIDRDDCGGVKLWHAAGTHPFSDEQLTELVLSALPDGGKKIAIGNEIARGYTTRAGVVVLIWKPARK